MVDKPDAPKVFLFSAGGPGARERMDRSVERGYAPILSRAFGLDFDAAGVSLPGDRLRAWGARPSPRNLTGLAKLEPGDLGIGYAEGEFAYVARFVDNLHSPALARQLWGDRGPDAEALIYLFDEVERLDLDRDRVLEALGYSSLFVPRGLMVPTEEHQPDALPGMSSASDLAEWLESEARLARASRGTGIASTGAARREARQEPKDVGTAYRGQGPGSMVGEGADSEPWRGGAAFQADSGPPPKLPDAYACIEAPPSVPPGVEFEIVVGLADRPQLDTGGSNVIPRPEGLAEYVLTVQLVTSAFELRADESPRIELRVTPEDPFPTVKLHLVTSDPEAEAGLLKVVYSVDAETVGFAVRAVAIVGDEQSRGPFDEPPQDPSFPFFPPSGTEVPDITVRIFDDERPGYLLWTMETPWPDLEVPAEPALIKIGANPQDFVERIVKGVSSRKFKTDLPDYINGQAAIVGGKVPEEFWALLRSCAERRRAQAEGGDSTAGSTRPRVLILTEDPYVPWELARMKDPLIEDSDLPQLAAQATVGRWIFSPHNEPPPPPPKARRVKQMAVVSGKYDPPLTEASAEASDLVKAFAAKPIEAKMESLIPFLRNVGASDALHFAMHGRYGAEAEESGLILADGEVLEPTSVRGVLFVSSPFVFLNVCQVGAGEELLGDYAGMSGAFVHAGASGVVAPLWSIADKSARNIAKEFYDLSQGAGGVSPAEYFRERRAGAADADLRTCIAYQFHGHPSMRVSA